MALLEKEIFTYQNTVASLLTNLKAKQRGITSDTTNKNLLYKLEDNTPLLVANSHMYTGGTWVALNQDFALVSTTGLKDSRMSGSLPISQVANTTLVGFTANSIIGCLNELHATMLTIYLPVGEIGFGNATSNGITSNPNFTWSGTQLLVNGGEVAGKFYTNCTDENVNWTVLSLVTRTSVKTARSNGVTLAFGLSRNSVEDTIGTISMNKVYASGNQTFSLSLTDAVTNFFTAEFTNSTHSYLTTVHGTLNVTTDIQINNVALGLIYAPIVHSHTIAGGTLSDFSFQANRVLFYGSSSGVASTASFKFDNNVLYSPEIYIYPNNLNHVGRLQIYASNSLSNYVELLKVSGATIDTAFGNTIAGSSKLVTSASKLMIGTFGTQDVIIGTNNITRIIVDSAGLAAVGGIPVSGYGQGQFHSDGSDSVQLGLIDTRSNATGRGPILSMTGRKTDNTVLELARFTAVRLNNATDNSASFTIAVRGTAASPNETDRLQIHTLGVSVAPMLTGVGVAEFPLHAWLGASTLTAYTNTSASLMYPDGCSICADNQQTTLATAKRFSGMLLRTENTSGVLQHATIGAYASAGVYNPTVLCTVQIGASSYRTVWDATANDIAQYFQVYSIEDHTVYASTFGSAEPTAGGAALYITNNLSSSAVVEGQFCYQTFYTRNSSRTSIGSIGVASALSSSKYSPSFFFGGNTGTATWQEYAYLTGGDDARGTNFMLYTGGIYAGIGVTNTLGTLRSWDSVRGNVVDALDWNINHLHTDLKVWIGMATGTTTYDLNVNNGIVAKQYCVPNNKSTATGSTIAFNFATSSTLYLSAAITGTSATVAQINLSNVLAGSTGYVIGQMGGTSRIININLTGTTFYLVGATAAGSADTIALAAALFHANEYFKITLHFTEGKTVCFVQVEAD